MVPFAALPGDGGEVQKGRAPTPMSQPLHAHPARVWHERPRGVGAGYGPAAAKPSWQRPPRRPAGPRRGPRAIWPALPSAVVSPFGARSCAGWQRLGLRTPGPGPRARPDSRPAKQGSTRSPGSEAPGSPLGSGSAELGEGERGRKASPPQHRDSELQPTPLQRLIQENADQEAGAHVPHGEPGDHEHHVDVLFLAADVFD
jgi:hypothetical protein